MKKYKRILTGTLLLISSSVTTADTVQDQLHQVFSGGQVETMLARADAYRLGQASTKIVTNVLVYRGEELESQNKYHVYIKPKRKSLVLFKGAGEEGQKMLMLQDNYWLLMPRSRRPIRITPMQKLLGGASIGDIATLTWSEDYQGQFEISETLQQRQTHKLGLVAKTKGASYQKISLWLDSESYFPVKAELYLKSGKLAKVAHFVQGQRGGQLVVEEMVLVDSINTNTKTKIRYESSTVHTLADKFYNPAYLSRQSITGL
ncbi:outer membrane lipoprotein-sorting protein [Microbulbifer sp. OS29]|uniref:Outer membrane lipoprotein-sorting protein n=1 Tax=Microbulbifer okhotskensis TaxID=2926617 RepID=A0A9X2ERB1_9GAMM|nr:outer membrane lipoprotein-sorting protein [Microbulbifer okhotskensis]MCO1336355.1 outer membrane lipoprotein-sorting protein [Microbulbifer okhotskensis]